MPSSVFFGMQHLNNNMICAVRVNSISKGGEPFELCVLPLNHMLEVHPEIMLFNMRMQPLYVDNIDWDYIHANKATVSRVILEGFDSAKVADLLQVWFDQINMPNGKRIIPISYNWCEQKQVLIEWMGQDDYLRVFSDDYRDVLIAAHYLNDKHAVCGEPVPFSKQTLTWLAKTTNSEKINSKGGDPVHDCYLIAQIYKRLLQGV